MTKITEIFVLKIKSSKRIDAVREAARKDFLSIEGVDSWETFVTTDPNRPTLFAEIYEFPDHTTAKRVTPQFAEREATKAFLKEIDEIIVGQYFTKHQPKGN